MLKTKYMGKKEYSGSYKYNIICVHLCHFE